MYYAAYVFYWVRGSETSPTNAVLLRTDLYTQKYIRRGMRYDMIPRYVLVVLVDQNNSLCYTSIR